MSDFRCQIARHLGFGRKGLDAAADQMNRVARA